MPPSAKDLSLDAMPFEALDCALNILPEGPERDLRVGATIFKLRNLFSSVNIIPGKFQLAFDEGERIGRSSSTVHAEISALLHFKGQTQNTSISVTDPLCPNCMKSLCEAGVKNIYIDENGFEKDFARRRKKDFDMLSLSIARAANVNVSKINLDTRIVKPLNQSDMLSQDASGIFIRPISVYGIDAESKKYIEKFRVTYERWACAVVRDKNNNKFFLAAASRDFASLNPGLKDIFADSQQYSSTLEPIDRIMMNCARLGLSLKERTIWSSAIPSSREQVNMVAMGIQKIHIGNVDRYFRDCGYAAMDKLQKAGIVSFNPMTMQSFVDRLAGIRP